MNNDALAVKYRPQAFEEVIGQPDLVAALQGVVSRKSSHTFLFEGPSGCGKTTLARITAAALGCTEIKEEDAATNNGIEAMRLVTTALQYKPLNGGAKGIIIDETQALSKQAWQSLLKSLEEPPEWAYWFLCTTEFEKVPKAAVTRSAKFTVKPVRWETLSSDLLIPIADAEQMACPDEVIGVCARLAEGSPRQALVNLAVCADVTDPAIASSLLRATIDDEKVGIDLARALMKGVLWPELIKLVAALKDENPEGIRRVICAYCTTAVLGAKTKEAAIRPLSILDKFSTPFTSADGFALLVLALGKLVTGR